MRKIGKCLFQGMYIDINEYFEQPPWQGFCYGFVKDAGENKFVIQPVKKDSPWLLIPVNAVYIQISKHQHEEEDAKIFVLSVAKKKT